MIFHSLKGTCAARYIARERAQVFAKLMTARVRYYCARLSQKTWYPVTGLVGCSQVGSRRRLNGLNIQRTLPLQPCLRWRSPSSLSQVDMSTIYAAFADC